MLTLTDTSVADLSGASINTGVVGDTSIKDSDSVTLIKNASGITTTGTSYGKLTEGVTLNYDLALAENDAHTTILATVTKISLSINSKTKSRLETQAVSMNFLNSGVDRFVSSGISSARLRLLYRL